MTRTELVEYAKKARRVNKDEFILAGCKDKTVLDVGCIGQDRNFESENWLHKKLLGVSRRVDGVDINEELVKLGQQKGYSIYLPGELTQTEVTYNMVVMADVIEHVNDPVEFLKHYSNYLEPAGALIVSTPNSNRANNFINILFNNNYSVNDEHTFWFCPKTFFEVVRRANLNIVEFYWVNHYYSIDHVKGWKQRLKFFLINRLIKLRTNFSPNMMFVIKK